MNGDNASAKNTDDNTFLRDILAIDRTKLANERTLLAYVRTALAIAVVGGSLLKFFESVSARGTGAIMMVAAGIMLATGVVRFRRVHKQLRAQDAFKNHV